MSEEFRPSLSPSDVNPSRISREEYPGNAPDEFSFVGHAEETLRLLAALPPPTGLEDRIRHRVRYNLADKQAGSQASAMQPKVARGFWSLWMPVRRLQYAGAALLMFAVAGSTWSIYHSRGHVQPLAQQPQGNAFGSAAAVRHPSTLTPIPVASAVTGKASGTGKHGSSIKPAAAALAAAPDTHHKKPRAGHPAATPTASSPAS